MLRRLSLVLLCLLATSVLTACESATATWCGTQQWIGGPYQTEFELKKELVLTRRNLGRRVLARAPVYKIRTSSKKVQGCDSLVLNKKLSLYRKPNKRFIFTERQEYYASDKTLIAVHEQDLTDQLDTSGRYTSSGELPIPHSAPTGKYRVVSKLILKRKGSKRSFKLAQATTWFRIVR